MCRAAAGSLCTNRYLPSTADSEIAQQDFSVTWLACCRPTVGLVSIDNYTTLATYHYGGLRLTRLSFQAPLLVGKSQFRRVHAQFDDFFTRLYGHMLCLHTVRVAELLVALTAEQLVAAQWVSMEYTHCWSIVHGAESAGNRCTAHNTCTKDCGALHMIEAPIRAWMTLIASSLSVGIGRWMYPPPALQCSPIHTTANACTLLP